MVKSKQFRVLMVVLAVVCILGSQAFAQKRRRPVRHLTVCGNPNITCTSTATFQPYDLRFSLPRNAVIYDTELFYAVMLRSVSTANNNCDNFIPEPERLAAQVLFPDHKVFASRCPEPGTLSYSNTKLDTNFMAVYAGTTLAEANRMLAKVRATGKFLGANIRRMRAVMNGT